MNDLLHNPQHVTPLSSSQLTTAGWGGRNITHDQVTWSLSSPLKTIKVTLSGLDKPQLIVLCHYAMRVWDRSHYGSWHLYGHSHGNLPPVENSLDVGVDVWDLAPISLENVGKAVLNT